MTILSWQIGFARPLSFAVLAALPLWIVFWRRSLVRLSAGRRVLSILLRMLMLADVAGSLVGLTATHWLEETVLYGDLTLARHGDFPEVALSTPGHVRAGEPFVRWMMLSAAEILRQGENGTAPGRISCVTRGNATDCRRQS